MLTFVSYISGWSASGITSQPKHERERIKFSEMLTVNLNKKKLFIFHFENN